MVMNGRIVDSSFLATPASKIKLKKPLMEPGPGMTKIMAGRRVKLASVATPSVRGTTTVTTLIPTAQQTAQQKARRILDDHAEWQERENRRPIKPSSSSPCIVSNYSIVASRGELSRNSFAVCETPAPTAKRKATITNGRVHREETPKSSFFGGEKDPRKQSGRKEGDKEAIKLTKTSKRAIAKSASVPANLKEVTREKQPSKGNLEEGILKKSSAFLTSLTQSCGRNFVQVNKSGSCESLGKLRKASTSNGYQEFERSKGSLTSVNPDKDVALTRSPSFQTLQTSLRKPSRVLVKKSVSFSKDTSFEAKRSSHKKTAIHEARVYRKGVLQDRGDTRESSREPTYESPSWDPRDFLRAAREADEFIFRTIVDKVRNSRLNDMDINAVDSSGRTAISYMAGNGAVAMLEVALSFPGVDPNLPDNEGNTPLHFAAQAGQTECLNALLQRCSDIEVDARNALGFTPLMKAALQGRTKCAKILLFAGANPTLRDHGRGLRAEQWARFCGRYVCAEVIERFARHRLLERTTSCRWGSEPELAVKVLQGKVTPIPTNLPPPPTGLRSKIRRVFRTTSGPDRSFSLVSQLTSAALCASSPALPKPEDVPPVVKSLLRPLSVPQLRITLVAPSELIERPAEKCGTNFTEKIASEKTENSVVKPPRTKKKNK